MYEEYLIDFFFKNGFFGWTLFCSLALLVVEIIYFRLLKSDIFDDGTYELVLTKLLSICLASTFLLLVGSIAQGLMNAFKNDLDKVILSLGIIFLVAVWFRINVYFGKKYKNKKDEGD